jgi:PilZ domain
VEWAVAIGQKTSNGSSGAERRCATRHPSGQRTVCQPIILRGAEPVPVVVRDLSTSGAGLICRKALPPNTFVTMELQSMKGGPSRRLHARVIHVTSQGRQGFLLGCAFSRALSAEQLAALL